MNPETNPFARRALEAAAETDRRMPLDHNLAQLVQKTIPQPADRNALRQLIEQINNAEAGNRRTAVMLAGIKNNGEIIFALLNKLTRYL